MQVRTTAYTHATFPDLTNVTPNKEMGGILANWLVNAGWPTIIITPDVYYVVFWYNIMIVVIQYHYSDVVL